MTAHPDRPVAVAHLTPLTTIARYCPLFASAKAELAGLGCFWLAGANLPRGNGMDALPRN